MPKTVTQNLQRIPWTIVVCTLGLILIGLSGIDRGDSLVGGGHSASRQTLLAAVGLIGMTAACWIPYRRLKPWSYMLFWACLASLVLVFFMPARNGAHRWIPLGLIDLQPSEIAKLAFIMALAHYLMYRRNYRRIMGLMVPFALMLIPVGLVLREPDLGSSLVFPPVLMAMLFTAGARPRHLVMVGVLCILLSPALWMGMSAEQKSRIVTVFRQKDSGPAPKGDGYQLHQSKRMIAAGGVWGSELVGTAMSDPMAYHLPEARTDFIFCLVAERWGFWGCLVTLSLYLVLFARGLMVANATREPFGRLLATGIVAMLAFQTVVNTGMTVGLMPVTGMTLPLMSSGGSSLLTSCLAIGFLVNIGMRPGYEVTSHPFRFSNKAS